MLARLRRFFDVRPGEGWAVAVTATYVGLAVASFLLAKPIRNGLFLGEYGAYKLVYVYIGTPIALSLFVPLYSSVAARFGMRAVITGTLLFFAATVVGFWAGLRFSHAPWLAAAFYIWVNCFSVVAPVQAWSFTNRVFDTRQARRLFGLVGAGASSGAILGGLLARVLVGPLGTENLLLVLTAMILLTAAVVNVGWGVRRRDKPLGLRRSPVSFLESLRIIGRSPYLRRIAALVVLVAIATQWATFQYSVLVDQRYPDDKDSLTAFFGEFNFYLGIIALAVQLFLTGPALRRFGIGVTILLLPVSLAAGSFLVVLWPVLSTVLLTSAFDGGFRFSIDKATFELLYLPLPSGVKSHVKGAIDVIFSRFADAIGGILLGFATQGFVLPGLAIAGLGLGVRGLAAVNLLFIATWVGVAVALKRGYIRAIQESIQAHRLDAERARATTLDRETADFLAGRLVATSRDEILYALEIFAMQHEQAPNPALRHLVRHPAPEVRRRVLELLDAAGDRDAAPVVEPLLEDPDLATRTEALLFLAHHAAIDPLARLEQLGDFPDFSVQAGLIAFYSRPGRHQNLDAARLLLDAMIDDQGPGAARSRLEAARLLGVLPILFEGAAERLLNDPRPEVVRQALASLGRTGRTGVAPRLIASLADPALAAAAATALSELGSHIVPVLNAALDSPTLPAEARRAIPAVLERIGTPDAQRTLVAHLLQPDSTLRTNVIAALNRLHARLPYLGLDREAIETGLAAEIVGHYRSYQILGRLQDDLGRDPVSAALRAATEQEQERIFRLMGLLWPHYDLESVYVALRSSNQVARANALELLENVLKPELRALVVPLIDPQVSTSERARLAARLVGAEVNSREDAVVALLGSDDPWLVSCGAHAAGVLGLSTVAGTLDRLATSENAQLRETARAALERLGRRAARDEMPADPETLVLSHDALGIG